MAVEEENVSKVFSILSHPLRRRILLNLSEKGECSFTELMNALDVDTGKLSFHIRSLGIFTEQKSNGKYSLSKVGLNAIRLIKELESWAEEAQVSGKESQLQLASFRKRAFAFLIDLLLMLSIAILGTLPNVFSLLTKGAASFSELNVVSLTTLVLLWGYSTLLEGFRGQSLGKRIVGLKVVRIDGRNLSYDYAAVRNFGKAFLLPFDLIIGLRLDDRRFIRYFDKYAGTTVVDLRA